MSVHHTVDVLSSFSPVVFLGGVVASTAATDPTSNGVWIGIISASVFAALINILVSIRQSRSPLDASIAGLMSAFAGIVLAPAFVKPLEVWIPGLSGAGPIAIAGTVALLGAVYIERLFRSMGGKSSSKENDK